MCNACTSVLRRVTPADTNTSAYASHLEHSTYQARHPANTSGAYRPPPPLSSHTHSMQQQQRATTSRITTTQTYSGSSSSSSRANGAGRAYSALPVTDGTYPSDDLYVPMAVSRSGDGSVPFGGTGGDLSAGLSQLRQLEEALQARLQSAEATARAVVNAQEVVNADAMLGRAREQGYAWTRDKTRLASAEATVDMSPLAVRAMQAERDELRHQVRQAAAELQKIQHAAGGRLPAVEQACQRDMERLARVRAQLVLEKEQHRIRTQSLEAKLAEVVDGRKAANLHISTAEEQLAERSEALLRLREQVDRLEMELHQTRQAAKDNLHAALGEQQARQAESAAADKANALERQQADARADVFRQLDAQREELERQHQNLLASKLSEQRHTLLAQANEDRARELQALQTELHRREQGNMQALQDTASKEHAAQTKALKQQHSVVQARLEGELESVRREAGSTLQRALQQQRAELMADNQAEVRVALDRQEKALWKRHLNEMEEMRDGLNRKHKDTVSAAIAKASRHPAYPKQDAGFPLVYLRLVLPLTCRGSCRSARISDHA